MSMRLAVNCPFCKRPMATSAAFTGQMIACPNCRGEFMLNSPALTPPATSTPSAPPPAAFLRPEPAAVETIPAIAVAEPSPAAPSRLAAPQPNGPAAPVAPPQSSNTARFKTATSTAPAIAAAADGKLPELMLADAAAGTAGEGGEKAVPLWLACMAVVGSTVVSAFLLLGDVPGQKSAESRHAEARQQLATFYGADATALAPYQVLLREAQQAHSRGDRATERQRYRQVLALLRAERRSKYETVTGTPRSDEQLAECLSILLGND